MRIRSILSVLLVVFLAIVAVVKGRALASATAYSAMGLAVLSAGFLSALAALVYRHRLKSARLAYSHGDGVLMFEPEVEGRTATPAPNGQVRTFPLKREAGSGYRQDAGPPYFRAEPVETGDARLKRMRKIAVGLTLAGSFFLVALNLGETALVSKMCSGYCCWDVDENGDRIGQLSCEPTPHILPR